MLVCLCLHAWGFPAVMLGGGFTRVFARGRPCPAMHVRVVRGCTMTTLAHACRRVFAHEGACSWVFLQAFLGAGGWHASVCAKERVHSDACAQTCCKRLRRPYTGMLVHKCVARERSRARGCPLLVARGCRCSWVLADMHRSMLAHEGLHTSAGHRGACTGARSHVGTLTRICMSTCTQACQRTSVMHMGLQLPDCSLAPASFQPGPLRGLSAPGATSAMAAVEGGTGVCCWSRPDPSSLWLWLLPQDWHCSAPHP